MGQPGHPRIWRTTFGCDGHRQSTLAAAGGKRRGLRRAAAAGAKPAHTDRTRRVGSGQTDFPQPPANALTPKSRQHLTVLVLRLKR